MSKTVFITGASGFIALHIIDLLLSKGYSVIGTVRSLSKASKITSQFRELYPNPKLSFEIVGDISIKGAFDEALKKNPDITEVLHTASPFSFGLDKPLEESYLIPATEGTRNILEAIKKYAPQVKHVVLTSSYAAIINFDKVGDKSFIHTEDTWNPITWNDVEEEKAAYVASKKLAEQLARVFVEVEKPNFSLTTINPPYVLGPQKFDEILLNPTLNTSAELVHKWLSLPVDDSEYHDERIGLTADVRDVALLHILPLENELLAGKRLFPVNGCVNGQVLINLIHKQFPELDGKVGKGKPEGAEKQVERESEAYDTSKTLECTRITNWVPIEKTIRDSVQQVLDYQRRTSN